MVRYEDEELSIPTKLDHVLLRLLDSMRRAIEVGDDLRVVALANELEDYALVVADESDKKTLNKLRKLEDYVIEELLHLAGDMGAKKITSALLETRLVFARERKRLALAALARNQFVISRGASYDLSLSKLIDDLNVVLDIYGVGLKLDVKIAEEVVGSGR